MVFGIRHGSLVRDFFDTKISDDEALILYLRYSGILLRTSNRVIAFDIADLLGGEGIDEIKSLDLLLYTHGHYDHFEYRSCIELFRKTDAYIVAEPSVARQMRGRITPNKLIEAKPGEYKELEDFKVYFIGGRHVGPITLYLVEYDDLRVFHGGDSAYVPLKEFRADIAFLPVGKPSPTASPIDALKMTMDLKPRIVIPIHGSREESRDYESLVERDYPGINVVRIGEYSLAKVNLK